MKSKLFLIFERDNSLVVHLGGYFDDNEMHKHSIDAIEVLEAKSLKVMLIDITKLNRKTNLFSIWTKKKFHKQAKEHNLESVAFITTRDYPDEISRIEISSKLNDKELKFGFFDTEVKALQWISELE